MIRHVAAAVFVVCVSPSIADAQSTVFTVASPSAEVHKGPSIATPVIGTARKGAALDVTRELGSWVSIPWPASPDGEAYIHVSRGTVAHTGETRIASASTSPTSFVAADVRRVEQAVLGRQSAAASRSSAAISPLAPVYATPKHVFGVGGRVAGPTFGGFGVSGRAWHNQIGVQLGLSHSSETNVIGGERLTSMQVEPSVLFSPRDHVSDYLWVRPYVGSGLSIHRHTLRSQTTGLPMLPSDNGVGFQAFGGGEFTMSGLPQFALGVDAGYRWTRTTMPGFDLDGMVISVSGHWYLK